MVSPLSMASESTSSSKADSGARWKTLAALAEADLQRMRQLLEHSMPLLGCPSPAKAPIAGNNQTASSTSISTATTEPCATGVDGSYFSATERRALQGFWKHIEPAGRASPTPRVASPEPLSQIALSHQAEVPNLSQGASNSLTQVHGTQHNRKTEQSPREIETAGTTAPQGGTEQRRHTKPSKQRHPQHGSGDPTEKNGISRRQDKAESNNPESEWTAPESSKHGTIRERPNSPAVNRNGRMGPSPLRGSSPNTRLLAVVPPETPPTRETAVPQAPERPKRRTRSHVAAKKTTAEKSVKQVQQKTEEKTGAIAEAAKQKGSARPTKQAPLIPIYQAAVNTAPPKTNPKSKTQQASLNQPASQQRPASVPPPSTNSERDGKKELHAADAATTKPGSPRCAAASDRERAAALEAEIAAKRESHRLQVLREERERRRKVEAERQSEHFRQRCRSRERLVIKKIEADADWQERTNAPITLAVTTGGSATSSPSGERCDEAELELGNAAFAASEYEKALRHFEAAAKGVAKPPASLLSDMASALLMLGQNSDCIEVCNRCLAIDPTCIPALLRRSRAMRCLLRLDDAIQDLQKALQVGCVAQCEVLREIQLLLIEKEERKFNSEVPDYVSILGLSDDYTPQEVASKYKKLALKWHPDRWASASTAEQKQAAEEFQKVNEAYSVLSDDAKHKEWKENFMKQQQIRRPLHARRFRKPPAKLTRSRSHPPRSSEMAHPSGTPNGSAAPVRPLWSTPLRAPSSNPVAPNSLPLAGLLASTVPSTSPSVAQAFGGVVAVPLGTSVAGPVYPPADPFLAPKTTSAAPHAHSPLFFDRPASAFTSSPQFSAFSVPAAL
eukprot:TRINITY_DN4079_c0_g1_i1.p1 TRINITY_DN4079_c0_g1~~TRINITY_DN4079_c0_g1_i1.p1  ORF type:complete len:847 (+),score=99.52 TRINITY_DN4079_c0_g1_i1:52-2592(+)